MSDPATLPAMLQIAPLREAYETGALTPPALVEQLLARLAAYPDPAVWISRVPEAALRARAAALAADPAARALPMYGIPFAVKDNIDVDGLETTAACPAFAFRPARSATVVDKLLAAGAIVIGKTNLDQFATGLVGARSPYGTPRSVFDSRYVSGGSSSGSAVAVAAGLVSFALGTDTAGSGRVPAGFNNLVGIKPTKGLLSNRGLLPACRSLDCITVFAATVGDGQAVRRIAEGFDPADAYSRVVAPVVLPAAPRFAVLKPEDREFGGDDAAAALYDAAVGRLTALGGTPVPFDYAPFREAATLLYGGAFVAERLAAIEPFFRGHAEAMDPIVRGIVANGDKFTAADAFRAQYRLEELKRETASAWAAFDVMLLPTSPTIVTVAALAAEPVKLNSLLGTYTNFVNLLDLSAIAVPAGFRSSNGLPFGVTLVGPAFADDALAVLADRLHRALGEGCGGAREALAEAPVFPPRGEDRIAVAVVGAHLSGMALNHQLTGADGRLLRATETAPAYRLYDLGGTPARPGLVRVAEGGAAIAVEVWDLPAAAFGRFVDAVPGPLGFGRLRLADGSEVAGFLCESIAVTAARDITSYGGWRAYRSA